MLTFVIVMAVSFLYIRTVGGNIRALAEEGDGSTRRSHGCPAAPRGGAREAAVEAAARRAGSSPCCWDAVVLICVFCLFPFYWLINVSLKTGADLSQADLFPPNPTLDNYDSIFKNATSPSAAQQRDRHGDHHDARAASAPSRPTRSPVCASR